MEQEEEEKPNMVS